MAHKTLLIVCGGQSPEHEISWISARYVASLIDRTEYQVKVLLIHRSGVKSCITIEQLNQGPTGEVPTAGVALMRAPEGIFLIDEKGGSHPIDIVFPVLHGPMGEDGTIQGWLEMLNIAYVGSGVGASAVCMDKHLTKDLLRLHGIPVVPYRVFTKGQNLPTYEALCEQLGTNHFFIKPASMGSSVGVNAVIQAYDYHAVVAEAFAYCPKILVEKAMQAREIECAVLGHTTPQAATVLSEIRPLQTFYSYEAKYLDPQGAELIIPAVLPGALAESIRRAAVKAFQLCGCSGMARVDFFVTEDTFYVSELNTIPGFTPISLYPQMWDRSGIPPQELIKRLITHAYEKHAERRQLLLHHSPGDELVVPSGSVGAAGSMTLSKEIGHCPLVQEGA